MPRWAERALVSVAVTVLLLGAALFVLTTPGYTRQLMLRTGGPENAGISRESAVAAAEAVRAYVVGSRTEPLPSALEGRQGFDQRAVSHLDDVRRVVSLARVLTAVAAGLLTAWVAWSLSRRRFTALVRGLRLGAVVTFSIVVAATVAALLDFGVFFEWFHGIFFAEGTWTFGYDELLIQLFPEPFWVVSAVAWALLALAGAGITASLTLAVTREHPESRVTRQ